MSQVAAGLARCFETAPIKAATWDEAAGGLALLGGSVTDDLRDSVSATSQFGHKQTSRSVCFMYLPLKDD